MKRFPRLFFFSIGLFVSAATAETEITEWSETGFVDLFNGKDLSGWQTTGNWVVEDGVVTLRPRPGEKGWQRYDAYLTTRKTYRNFVLDLEFMFEAAEGVRLCSLWLREPDFPSSLLPCLVNHGSNLRGRVIT